MHYLYSFICSLLLITTPTSLLCSQISFPKCPTASPHFRPPIKDLHLFSYDDILNLLDEIESGELEQRCSFEDLERINQYLVLLAREGGDSGDAVLQDDIRELEQGQNFYEYAFTRGIDQDYVIVPALFYGRGEVVLCKSWWKISWENTKAFISNHKKEIIIGAVIVVAVVTVVAVATIAGGAAAATVASTAAVAVEATESQKEEPKKTPDIKPEKSASEVAINQPSTLKEVIQEQIEPIKELAQKSSDSSFKETAREMGAMLTHEAFDAVIELASFMPELEQELVELGEKILPAGSIPEEMQYPLNDFEEKVQSGHEKIDQFFATNQAGYYSPKAKAIKNERITRCEIPLAPFGSSKIVGSKIGRSLLVEEEAAIIAAERENVGALVSESRVDHGGWSLPKNGGGTYIDGRWYTEHALERMAPNTPEVMAELETRFYERAKIAESRLNSKDYKRWYFENEPKPRTIPPSVIEAEISHPGSTSVEVILNEKGDVVTVIPKGSKK